MNMEGSMSAVDGANEPPDQFEQTRSILADLERRVGEARTRGADAIHERVRTSVRQSDSLSDCQALIREAGAYATVSQVLLELGHLDAAADIVMLGLSLVDAAQECLDGL